MMYLNREIRRFCKNKPIQNLFKADMPPTYSNEQSYASWLMKGLNDQRTSESSLCDVRLVVKGTKFCAHKAILCRASEYFNAMLAGGFKENAAQEIDLSETISSSCIMEQILNFMYTGQLDINTNNFSEVTQVASLLLLEPVKQKCVAYFIKTLNLNNCVDRLLVADEHDMCELKLIALEIVSKRCHDHIIHSDQLLNQPIEVLQFLKTMETFIHVQEKDLLGFLLRTIQTEIVVSSWEITYDYWVQLFDLFKDMFHSVSILHENWIAAFGLISGTSSLKRVADDTVLEGKAWLVQLTDALQNTLKPSVVNEQNECGNEEEVLVLCFSENTTKDSDSNFKVCAYSDKSKNWVLLMEAQIEKKQLRKYTHGGYLGIIHRNNTTLHCFYKGRDAFIYSNEKNCFQKTNFLDNIGGRLYGEKNQYFFIFQNDLYCLFTGSDMGVTEFYEEGYTWYNNLYRLEYESESKCYWEIMEEVVFENIGYSIEFQLVISETQMLLLHAQTFDFGVNGDDFSDSNLEENWVEFEPILINKIENGRLTSTKLPSVKIRNTTGMSLQYECTSNKDSLFLVPVHSRTVCMSAPIYVFNLVTKEWSCFIIESDDDSTKSDVACAETSWSQNVDELCDNVKKASVRDVKDSRIFKPVQKLVALDPKSVHKTDVGVLNIAPSLDLPIIKKKKVPTATLR